MVTYKYLSQIKKIHVNLAKSILEKYKESNEAEQLLTVYLLSGMVDESKRVQLVEEKSKAKVKELFCKLESEHIFSVQLAEVPFRSFYDVNRETLELDILGATKFSSISNISEPQLSVTEKNQNDDAQTVKIDTPDGHVEKRQACLSEFFDKKSRDNPGFSTAVSVRPNVIEKQTRVKKQACLSEVFDIKSRDNPGSSTAVSVKEKQTMIKDFFRGHEKKSRWISDLEGDFEALESTNDFLDIDDELFLESANLFEMKTVKLNEMETDATAMDSEDDDFLLGASKMFENDATAMDSEDEDFLLGASKMFDSSTGKF